MMPTPAPTPTLKNYTVYLSPTNTVQVQSATAPTIDDHGTLAFPAATFREWTGWIEGSAIPAPASTPAPTGGGLFGWLTGKS